jgi:hypothetical protein
MGHGADDPEASLSDEVLARISSVALMATPGPWKRRTERDPAFTGSPDPVETGEWETIIRTGAPGLTILASELSDENAEFVVVARQYLLALVDEVGRLRAQLGQ